MSANAVELILPCDAVAMGPDVVLVDVRSAAAFAAGHAPAAVHVELEVLEAGWCGDDARLPIAVLATDTDTAVHAASILTARNRDTYVIAGGMPAWHRAGHWIVTNVPGRYPTVTLDD